MKSLICNYCRALILLAVLLPNSIALGQSLNSDTLTENKFSSKGPGKNYIPNKAAILSTVLPGAGQFYNNSYWKIPLVWGGLAVFGGLAYYNNQQLDVYQDELDYQAANGGMKNNPSLERYSESSLENGRDQSIRYRDLNIILGIFWYGLNIMDAYVDAHLKEFEVTDNLSLGLTPQLYTNGTSYQPGLSLGLKFRP